TYNRVYGHIHPYAQRYQQSPRYHVPVFSGFFATSANKTQTPVDDGGGCFDELLVDANDQGDRPSGDAGDGLHNADQGASYEVADQRGLSVRGLAHLLTILGILITGSRVV